MTAKKTIAKQTNGTVIADDPDDRKGRLKCVGGSQSDHWNNIPANQALQTLWLKQSDNKTREKQNQRYACSAEGTERQVGRHDCRALDLFRR